MTKKESYESRVEAFLLPLMEENNFELVDVEYVKEAGTWYLRAYIDKEGGIAVDDCEVISRRLSDWLDKEDFIDDSYILEVSSPGLGRPLKKEKDYKRSIGREVEVRLYKAIDRQKEFTGTLSAYDDKTVTLAMEDGSEAVFEKADIALIRLALDFQPYSGMSSRNFSCTCFCGRFSASRTQISSTYAPRTPQKFGYN